MHPNSNVAPETVIARHNGHGDPGAPGIVLRNGLPMPILPQAQVSPHTLHLMIQTAAYFLAQDRGFLPGHELNDWLAAEELIGQALAGPRSSC
jgi:hypothetical protein